MNTYRLLFFLALCIATISCNGIREDLLTEGQEKEQSALELSVSMPMIRTKGLITGSTLPSGSEIGLTLLGSDGKVYDNLPYSNVKFTSEGNGSSQRWSTDMDVMLSGERATVYGYYPYSPEVSDIKAIRISATSETQTDYLYAVPVTDLNCHNPKAEIEMRHALAAVRLSIRKGSYSGTGTVSSVSIKGGGFGTEGLLDAKKGEIHSVIGNGTEICPEMDPITLTSSLQNIDIITVPAYTDRYIEMKVVIDGEEFQIKTEPVKLESGKIAVFEAVVNGAEVNLSSVNIADWTYSRKGNPVLKQDWSISLEGEIKDISFANSIDEDGSIVIKAVPLYYEAEINPVSVEGKVNWTQNLDPDRGIRTIVLSEIESDVIVKFDSFSIWATATFNISDTSSPTKLSDTRFGNMEIVNRMTVDGKEVEPSDKFLFSETGEHTVRYTFHPYIVRGEIAARFHIPEFFFYSISALTAVRIPEGYTTLCTRAFSSCENLVNISLPQSLTTLEGEILSHCTRLEEVVLPDNIRYLSNALFNGCTRLSKVKLPDNLENLGLYTFYNCTSLKEINIPESVISLGYNTFGSSGISKIYIPDSISEIPQEFCISCYSLEEVRLPPGLKTVRASGFHQCTALSSIITGDGTVHTGTFSVPESITTLENNAFYGLRFKKIHIPATLTDMEANALMGRTVEEFSVSADNPIYEVRSNAIVEKASNKLVAGCKNSRIDPTVTSIGTSAFYDCPITSVDLHEGITELENYAFEKSWISEIKSRSLTPPELGESVFLINIHNGVLKVPAEALEAYREKWMLNKSGYLGNSNLKWEIRALEEGE